MKILIVDDSSDNRLLLELLLEEAGYAFVSVASAKEAYHYLKINELTAPPTDIDCILMDIMMPEISGIEAVKAIKKVKTFQDVPIIMVTAKSEDSDLAQAFEAGAVDYIMKPIHETQLMIRLASALLLKQKIDLLKQRESELLLLHNELLQKNLLLSNALNEINKDLAIAAKMQRALLPVKQGKKAFVSVEWYFEPSNSVGGDLLNILQLDADHIAFYIFDVSGHGIQAALMAVSINRLLSAHGGGRNLVQKLSGEPYSPIEVLTKLNEEFLMIDDDFHYFTITYGVFNTSTGVIKFVRAGHTPLLLQRANGNFQIIEEGDFPLGIIEGAVFNEYEISLETNDRLFLYSDGISEAKRLEAMEAYGDNRLYTSIKATAGIPLSEAIPKIICDVKTWLASNKPQDDISLLGIERLK